jgi:hypothetical protein
MDHFFRSIYCVIKCVKTKRVLKRKFASSFKIVCNDAKNRKFASPVLNVLRIWTAYPNTHTVSARQPKIFQKFSSQVQIPGAKRITWCKLHSKNPQFWNNLWTSLLSGTFCLVHVNWCTYLCIRRGLTELCLWYRHHRIEVWAPLCASGHHHEDLGLIPT